MNWVKQSMLIRLWILIVQLKKLTMLPKKTLKMSNITPHRSLINQFNKLAVDNKDAKLKGADLASKNDTVDLAKNVDSYEKLKSIIKKVILNKSKHVLVENELNNLSEKVTLILTKGLTKDLINGYSILTCTK